MVQKETMALTNLRMLALDTIQNANSGHPGIALDAAPIMYTLYKNHMVTDPTNPNALYRDRFVLSAGHGSALLYATLHMFGFDLTIKDLKRFRKYGSKTPGHPEYGIVPGVDATTGPLGQGLGMAVGMAISEKHLRDMLATKSTNFSGYNIYALCGDGDLMEGISHEAASIAGFLKLNKLIVLYDSNQVSLDGNLNRETCENVEQRFRSYGWNYLEVNGNDIQEINTAIKQAKKSESKPTIIECHTTIGIGTPQSGTNLIHGSVLSDRDYKATRSYYNWDNPHFYCDESTIHLLKSKLLNRFNKRKKLLNEDIHQLKLTDKSNYLKLSQLRKPNFNFLKFIPNYKLNSTVAGRDAIKKCIEFTASRCPNLIGGSADVASSTKAYNSKSEAFNSTCGTANNLIFGVREFASAAIVNGILLSKMFKAYTSTFLAFSDYMKPAIRLAAIQKIPSIFIFTHDSVMVGEDGPTHQPVEQIMGLRSIPNLRVIRPTDANEVIKAWKIALTATCTPTVLILSRQALPIITKSEKIKFGGYVLNKNSSNDSVSGILMGSGSEISPLLTAQKKLKEKNINVSVVTIPDFYTFDHQSKEYKDKVLPKNIVNRLSLEAGSTLGWEKYVGIDGVTMGVDQFGKSGSEDNLKTALNLSSETIVNCYLKHFTTAEKKG